MKPIVITRIALRAYTMTVNGIPIVKDGKGMNFDRIAAGLKGGKGWVAPPANAPYRFASMRAAQSIAHHIGRYILGFGDFVSAYTATVEMPAKPYLDLGSTWPDGSRMICDDCRKPIPYHGEVHIGGRKPCICGACHRLNPA